MLSLFILIPFLLLIIFNLPFRSRNEALLFILTGTLLAAQALLVLLHPVFWSRYTDPLARFFAFGLETDSLSLIVLFTIALIAFISLVVARSTITKKGHKLNFINLLLLVLIGMNATVLARDIFTLYVSIEIIAVSAFVLMALEKNKFAIEGTFKYLMLSIIASVFMLTSTAFFILATGSTSFSAIHNAFLSGQNTFFLNLAVGIFLCGSFIKCGLVPFHGWVADAYSDASASVSILLAGIITKVSGVYVLLRLFTSVFVLSPSAQNALMAVGLLSIIVAAFAALAQGEMKRMLAYSSISQMGYIVLALGCGTPLALAGAVFHFFNHAIFKSLLFVNAAALEKKFGSSDTTIITGLGWQLPVTNVTSLIGLLSTAGIPPLSGFWSKLIIIVSLWSAGRFGFAAIALLMSIMTLAYFLSLEQKVFFIRSEMDANDTSTVPLGIKFSEVLLAAITIGVGLAFPFIFSAWLMPLKDIIR